MYRYLYDIGFSCLQTVVQRVFPIHKALQVKNATDAIEKMQQAMK